MESKSLCTGKRSERSFPEKLSEMRDTVKLCEEDYRNMRREWFRTEFAMIENRNISSGGCLWKQVVWFSVILLIRRGREKSQEVSEGEDGLLTKPFFNSKQ